MRIISRRIVVMTAIAMIIPVVAISQLANSNSAGGRAGAAMRMGFGARGLAMGNAMTSVINGDVQSYYNPAVVPFETEPTFAVTYGILSLDRKLNYLSYTKNLKPNAGFSLSIINAGVGNIDGYDRNAVQTGTLSTSENAFLLSFGLKPAEKFSLGVSVKVLYYSLYESVKSTTAGVDVGALYLLSQEWTLGAVVQDITAKYKWDTSKLYGQFGNTTAEYFPLRKRAGITWMPKEYPVMLTGEVEAIGSAVFLRAGSELKISEGVYVRGGLDQIAVNNDVPAKPALGLSVQTKVGTWTPSFQYAYVFEPYSPSGLHILSIVLRFQ
ncbi:MAG: PorV/PorQ family protein [Ignavibacteriae bacterium]|nr:MAG: PorV/PorQ family protein [Ignavibacteriota bacterium]